MVADMPKEEHEPKHERQRSGSIKSHNADFHDHLPTVLKKLTVDPTTITPEDARRLHEHYDAKDVRSALVISAVEAVAAAHDEIQSMRNGQSTLQQEGHASLLTLVEDLKAAVDTAPQEVSPEILKLTQSIITKMQKAVGNASAPHPELETKLQQEYEQIRPKVIQGTVTKAEADHLHSLEARAHGHTEKGGLTAIAQSIVAKRERQLSLSEGSSKSGSPDAKVSLFDMGEMVGALGPKTENTVPTAQ